MRTLEGLRVCRFGRYDPDYSRNRILAKCLQREGATVIEIVEHGPAATRWPRLLGRALAERFDLMLLGFRAHADVPLARIVASRRRVPLVFDPLISRYDEKVADRRLVAAGHPMAWWYFETDRLGCRLADLVLLDTETHIAHFVEAFGVSRSKFRRLWIGADDEIISPRPRGDRDEFTVFFYGRFNPLQGVEHIIGAAAELERRHVPARFVVVGRGQTYGSIRALADELGVTTVTFLDPVPYGELATLMGRSDVCLGVFGTTDKAGRVISNKIFDALAAGRALVTADTPAVREALVHGEHAWLCPAGDSRALADALVRLRDDDGLRTRLADNGHRLFQERFSLAAISRDLAAVVSPLVDAGRASKVGSSPAKPAC